MTGEKPKDDLTVSGRRIWKRARIGYGILVVAVIFGLGQAQVTNANARRRNKEQTIADVYRVCLAINANNMALKQIVETAYSQGAGSVNPRDFESMPKITQQLISDLQPLIRFNAARSLTVKNEIEASIPKQQTCIKP